MSPKPKNVVKTLKQQYLFITEDIIIWQNCFLNVITLYGDLKSVEKNLKAIDNIQ